MDVDKHLCAECGQKSEYWCSKRSHAFYLGQSLVSRACSAALYSGCVVKDRGELWSGFMLK